MPDNAVAMTDNSNTKAGTKTPFTAAETMTATVVTTTGATTQKNGHATPATYSTAAGSVSTAEGTPAMAAPAAPETDGAKQAKIVFVVPEQTPPAVRFVLGRRRGWTEWNAEVHGVDEVC